uniref:Putative mitochondrial intermediate peptidase isoform X3 n=1 Tax=Rhizophora mucronata TaxID=61149 RepID=A0A2P2M040_RHIMU
MLEIYPHDQDPLQYFLHIPCRAEKCLHLAHSLYPNFRMEDGFHPFQSQCAGDGQPYEPPLTANVHLALLSSPVHIEYDLY